MGWQPIDEATDEDKDGRDVLVTKVPGGRQLVAQWNPEVVPGGGWVATDSLRQIEPTHFQPLGLLPDDPEAPIDSEPGPGPHTASKKPAAKSSTPVHGSLHLKDT